MYPSVYLSTAAVSICGRDKIHEGEARTERGVCPFSRFSYPEAPPLSQDQGLLPYDEADEGRR